MGADVALRTSGTTRASRFVVRSTRSWTDSFPHVTRLLDMDADAAVWAPGPLSATMNLFAAVHARFVGARLVDGPEAATHVHLTPTYLRRLLTDGVDLAGRHVVVAGDRLGPGPAADAAAAGARTSHYYGSAELSFVAWGSHAADLHPFPGAEVDVREDTVWVRSPYLCSGYRGEPGPLRTDAAGYATVGDRGVWESGRLVVHGRGDEALTVGGATVLVADVEQVLTAAATGDVVVVGVPHPGLGQVAAAVLTDDADLPAVRDAARRTLAGAMRPRRWFAVDELPTTSAGKVDRRALVHRLVSGAPGVRALA